MDTIIAEYEHNIQNKFTDIVGNIYSQYKVVLEHDDGRTSTQSPEDFFDIIDIHMSILKQESEVTTKIGRIIYKVVCNSLLKLAYSLMQ